MQILDLIKQLYNETGIMINRSRLYHYDNMGLLGNIERDDSNYREFDRENYKKIKTIVILSDLGVGLDDIDNMLKRDYKVIKEVKEDLNRKQVNVTYALEIVNSIS